MKTESVGDNAPPDSALRALLSRLDTGQILRAGRNLVVAVDSDDPRLPPRVVIKRFGPARGLRGLSSLWRGKRGLRALHIARALHDAGVPTPRPLGYLEADGAGHLFSEEVPSARPLRDVLDDLYGFPDRRRPALVAAARAVRALHDAGWLHGDLTLGNILVSGERAFLIDLNRARQVGAPSLRARARDLARLRACECLPLRERPRGATCGFPPGCQRRWLWEAYEGARARETEPLWLAEVARAKRLVWLELWIKRRWPQEIAYRTRPLPK